MEKNSKIYVAGHTGLAGSAIVRELKRQGYKNLILKTHAQLDLRNQEATKKFFEQEKPEYIFDAAAKVGGVKANAEKPAEFIYDNLQIQNNLIHFSLKYEIKKFLFLGSNCVYPVNAEQPFKEESLMAGPVESTNEPYAVAKIAGIKLGQAYAKQYGLNFIALIPCSLFGPNDNFDLESSHLVPALIRKFHEAKINNSECVNLWGTGESSREIMYVDDAAKAAIFLMNTYNSQEPLNAGINSDYTINEIALMIKKIIDFRGEIKYEGKKLSGIKRKIINSEKIYALGWKPETSIIEGLKETYNWFKSAH